MSEPAGQPTDPIIGDHASGPIFLDPSGRRWRLALAAALLLGMVVGYAVVTVIPWALSPPELDRSWTPTGLPRITGVPAQVGSGPLMRVLAVRHTPLGVQGLDPFTGRPVALLSAQEAAAAGPARFVVQRFGYPAGSTHVICLTFDDGPDPVYTPRLLAVLARQQVPATFFLIGQQAAANPQLVRRIVREGHAIGNHSLTHPDLTRTGARRAEAELVLTDRVLRAVAGQRAAYVRIPYGGLGDGETAGSVQTILRLQQWGYLSASFDADTQDWAYDSGARSGRIGLPPLDGRDLTVLLHDGGGNRQRTIDYVDRVLIPAARARGYTFRTMPQALPDVQAAYQPVQAGPADRITLGLVTVVLVWPNVLLRWLFLLAVAGVAGVGLAAVGLAGYRRIRRPRYPADLPQVPVSVVIAAYNEEAVIARTLHTLLGQSHPVSEIIVVDDGSGDGTAAQVQAVARTDARVRLLRQPNSGKSAALNRGFACARGDVVVTLDADTVFTATTVACLVRQFEHDGGARLGAVAGVIRVGNREHNLLTRWQALEYLTQIGIERSAYVQLGAVPVVSGACAAWRRAAVLGVGGYSGATLAEDCDLAVALQAAGWRISQDDDAIAFTEAPMDADSFLAQRIRWTYGTLQALTKHRRVLLRPRYGWLGMVVLPYNLACIVLPVVFIPFVVVMAVRTVLTQGWWLLLAYFAAFALVHAVVVACAVVLMRDTWRHLALVPLYRLIFEPLRLYLLYTSVYLAVRGARTGWKKLHRSGELDATARQLASGLPATPGLPSTPGLASGPTAGPAAGSPAALSQAGQEGAERAQDG